MNRVGKKLGLFLKFIIWLASAWFYSLCLVLIDRYKAECDCFFNHIKNAAQNKWKWFRYFLLDSFKRHITKNTMFRTPSTK